MIASDPWKGRRGPGGASNRRPAHQATSFARFEALDRGTHLLKHVKDAGPRRLSQRFFSSVIRRRGLIAAATNQKAAELNVAGQTTKPGGHGAGRRDGP